ncbi:MAG: PAS domain S-box protein [Pirellulaceae bacterium]|nr:PAS domain S-box protein [Pirellulaceae bacterium]
MAKRQDSDAEPHPTPHDLVGPGLEFAVVGMGASAGGLSAFKKFFNAMPIDSGAAFVLVPHLDPTHQSLMVELVARQTKMPVCEARDGMSLEPNHVYVIPPNKYLTLQQRRLQLSELSEKHVAPTAIDGFFRSLAREQLDHAIGIVLSGTSSHGTPGIKEIKLVGGMVMAQRPETAEYDSMPRHAIATGLVDYILPPEEMPAALLRYLQHPYIQTARSPVSNDDSIRKELNRILAVLKASSKHDFRSYRSNMLQRRVLRRMGICHLEHFADYVDYLQTNPAEVTALYNDLLIGVTQFFRDAEAFQVLEQRVIPELLGSVNNVSTVCGIGNPRPPTLRVWIPACASGEEAYSIGMLLLEQIGSSKRVVEIQIFATDIDERSLEGARQGIYLESNIEGVSPERRQRFFTKIDSQHWQVNKQLRETITFAPQNLIGDAPFSKLDLISCRNLLIYLEPSVQAKIIRLFHFSLKDRGYLMLGPAESIGREIDLFEPISKKWRVFRRRGPVRRELLEIPIVATDERRRLRLPHLEVSPSPAMGYKELLQRLVLDNFAPAAVLINHKYEIVSVLGPLVRYLEFPPGEITNDVLAMARPGLRTKIRTAVYKAFQSGNSVTEPNARVKRDGKYFACSIAVKPVMESKDAAGLLLVTFQDHAMSEAIAVAGLASVNPSDEIESHLLRHLEEELKFTREDLQSTIEEYESSTEELKASNEEVMSMNEELQSANEELESSKEELQSLNEELSTVNSQLQESVEELDRSNSDLTNLMASSEVATLFLDTQLRIQRFTPYVARLLNLRDSDVDRPISDLSLKFDDGSLLEDCRAVLEKKVPREKEVWTKNEATRLSWQLAEAGQKNVPTKSDHDERGPQCYLRRILPYRTGDQRIDGVVITFFDITDRLLAETRARRLAAVLLDANDAIIVHDFEGRILAWNRGAKRLYGYSEPAALRMNIRDIVPEGKRAEAWDYVQSLLKNEAVGKFETQRLAKDGQLRDMELTVTAYRNEHGELMGVATTERDISERNFLARSLEQVNQTLELRVAEQTQQFRLLAEAVSHLGEGVLIAGNSVDWPGPQIVFVNEALCRITGYSAEELIGQTPRMLQGPESQKEPLSKIKQNLATNHCCAVELKNYRKDGSTYDAELFITPLFNAQGKRTHFVSIHRDISARKRAEANLKYQEELARSIIDALSAHVALLDSQGTIVRVNAAWERFARENQAERLERVGVGANYLEVCRKSSSAGDAFAAEALEGIQAILNHSSSEFQLEYPCHSGQQQLWFILSVTPIDSPGGGVVIAHRNITELKRAEALARAREEQLSAILNTAADAIITIDARGTITLINRSTERLFGYSAEEMLGKNVNMLMPSPFREEHDSYLARYIQTGEAKIIGIGREVLGERKDGSIFPMDLAVSEVDHSRTFTGIIRDISDRTELQKHVLEIAAEQDRRIGQELHDNVQQQLTGLGMLAKSLANVLQKQARPEFGKAERLAQGLADVTKITHLLARGLIPVEIDSQGLHAALTELAENTQEMYGVECRFRGLEPLALADNFVATHLFRIAQEAITNALKHGRATTIEIVLERRAERIALVVLDNGIGIDLKDKNTSGKGLRIMRYRAGLIGATLDIKPGVRSGTQVTCSLSRKNRAL